MIKEELIQRSPIRIFEQSINGGLKAGEIGIIASQSGIGKTSVLVQLALDKLLQGKKVIHVSFAQHTQHVITWYENIFDEFISRKNLDDPAGIKDGLVKNRVLMNFNQDSMSIEQIVRSLRAMIVDGGFAAEAVIVDGFDFSRDGCRHLACVKAFAVELGLSVWYSCTVKDGGWQFDRKNAAPLPEGVADLADVIVVLEPRPDHIALSISKDRDSGAAKAAETRLDPKTLLIL
ncbi:MAG: hypothetical protein FWH38_07850 [Treponema sp.]|nr:hypothetical protein [Treponema sp.]